MFKNETTTAVVNANQLRLAAEKADGYRGIPLAIVEENGSIAVMKKAEADAKGLHPLLEVMTPLEGPGIPGDARIKLLWRDKEYPNPDGPPAPLAIADAVFVSQSAVGKFVLPYYIHFRSGTAVQDLQNKLFLSESVIAAVHIPPTDPYAVKAETDFFALNSGRSLDDELEVIPIGRGY